MINRSVLKVKDHPTMYRDPNSKAILVVDQSARQNYLNQKALAQKTAQTAEDLQEEMNSMKQELTELKAMLRYLVEKSNSSIN